MNGQEQNLTDDLRQILGYTILGGVKWQNVVIAHVRAHEWCAVHMPPTSEERGGSSSPVEVAERVEDRRVAAQAARDIQVLPTLREAFEAELVLAKYAGSPTRELAKVAEDLARIVARYTQPVDHTLLPKDSPSCRSCARPGKVGGVQYEGHKGVDVFDLAKKHGLCRFCYRYATADAKAKGKKGIGQFPPVDIIDVLHTKGARAAGIALARRVQRQGVA